MANKIYWWDTKHLAKDLKDNLLSEHNKMKYFLATSLLLIMSHYLAHLRPHSSLPTFTEMLLMIFITIFGIKITFKTNNGNNGLEYIVRMTCLSFPITLKLFVLSFVFGITLGILMVAFPSGKDLIENEWIILIFTVLIQGIYFWRLNIHLKYINARQSSGLFPLLRGSKSR